MFTKKSFVVAIILVLLIIVLIVVSSLWPSQHTGGYLMPPLVSLIIACCLTGSYLALRSFKEPTNYKKVIGMVFNIGTLILIIALLVSNLMDMVRMFNQ